MRHPLLLATATVSIAAVSVSAHIVAQQNPDPPDLRRLEYAEMDPHDYSQWPEEERVIEDAIGSLALTITEAVARAKELVGGGVMESARVRRPRQFFRDLPEETPPDPMFRDLTRIEVILYHEGKRRRVLFNAQNGETLVDQTVGRFYGWQVNGPYVESPLFVRHWDHAIGEGEAATRSSVVHLHADAYLTDGRLFFTTRAQETPWRIDIANDRVLVGLLENLPDMREGGKRTVVIPFNVGHGEPGNPGQNVPPRATVIYDIELIKVERR